jgi:hypothetical protein
MTVATLAYLLHLEFLLLPTLSASGRSFRSLGSDLGLGAGLSSVCHLNVGHNDRMEGLCVESLVVGLLRYGGSLRVSCDDMMKKRRARAVCNLSIC